MGKQKKTKILFSDSRDKTKLYKMVALELIKYEVDVFWVIQNHAFNPRVGEVFLIPYPKKEEVKAKKEKQRTPQWIYETVKRSDRMVKYYGYKADHYHYYYTKMFDYVKSVGPDLIVGEPGNFHTHILCCIAKDLGILFVDPASARYPTGKFRLHKFDRIDPLVISNDASFEKKPGSPGDEYERLLSRDVLPDYMKRQEVGKVVRRFKTTRLQAKVLFQRVAGDKYGTPSFYEFLKSRFISKKSIRRWDIASTSVDLLKDSDKKKLLYPLQMQPECNLDVWGVPFDDQEKLISFIAKRLPSDWVLVVKPNPKSKLEMSQGLVRLLEVQNILALNHSVTMDEVLPYIDNVITVTGTIALERMLSSEPVIILGDTDYAKVGKAVSINSIEFIEDCLSKEGEGLCGKEFYNYLDETSFPGLIAEPTVSNESLGKKNIENIASVLLCAAQS